MILRVGGRVEQQSIGLERIKGLDLVCSFKGKREKDLEIIVKEFKSNNNKNLGWVWVGR